MGVLLALCSINLLNKGMRFLSFETLFDKYVIVEITRNEISKKYNFFSNDHVYTCFVY